MSRICCIPLLIWMLSSYYPFRSVHGEQEIAASLLFILASITDGVDGYLARKRGQITTMGMLLDPLADKLMITAAYVCLVQFNPHLMKAWVVVLVIGREFLVSGLRSLPFISWCWYRLFLLWTILWPSGARLITLPQIGVRRPALC